jgi:hypothetical protein
MSQSCFLRNHLSSSFPTPHPGIFFEEGVAGGKKRAQLDDFPESQMEHAWI